MSKTIKLLTLGADPEVFILDNTGSPISSENLLPGDKDNPFDMGDSFFVQKDNVMGEYNIPPSTTEEEFESNLKIGLSKVFKFLPEGFKVSVQSEALFNRKQLETPQGRIFGCSPDLSAYTLDFLPIPSIGKEFYRYAGGHVHLGFDDPFEMSIHNKADIIKLLDLYIGIPMLFCDPNTRRREIYGTAGRFRDKSYGVEYRTPSNNWIDKHAKSVFKAAHLAVNHFNTEGSLSTEDSKVIEKTINNSDFDVANHICEHFKIPQF